MMVRKWEVFVGTMYGLRQRSFSIWLHDKKLQQYKNKIINQIRQQRREFSNHYQQMKRPYVLKPFVFTFSTSIVSFAGCAILQYERKKSEALITTYWDRIKLHREEKALIIRRKINTWWNLLHEGHKIATFLIGVNILTFGCWQIRIFHPFMRRWFTSYPRNKRSSALLLACFSHSEFWHLGANMFVLWSFAPLIQSILGTEQLIAFYITGGCASSLVSHIFKVAIRSSLPSLGASGALLAVLGACCIEQPEARLSILFLPFFTFSAKSALIGIITLDVAGLLFRWRLFDHACHLGGTLFGAWYVTYGRKFTWDKRAPITRTWHELRKSLE